MDETTVDTPVESNDFAADLDATFATAPTTEAEDTPASSDSQGELTAPTPTDTPAETAPADTDPLDGMDPDLRPDEIGKNRGGKEHWRYSPERAKKLHGGLVFQRAITEALPGITVEDAKSHFEGYATHRQLEDNFLNSAHDPKAAFEFVNHFVKQGQQRPEALGQISSNFLEATKQLQPDVYQQRIVAPIVEQALRPNIQSTYKSMFDFMERAQATGDAGVIQLATDLLKSVQTLDYNLTGKYETGPQANAQAQNPADPQKQYYETQLAEQQKKLDSIRQANEQQQRQQYETAEKALDAHLENKLRERITAATDKLKDAYAGRPEALKIIQANLFTPVLDRMFQDEKWKTVFESERQRTVLGDEASRERLTQRFLARLEPMIAAELKPLMEEHTQAQLATSQAKHQKLQQAASNRAPAASGVPAQKSIVPVPRTAGTSAKKAFLQELDEVFASPGTRRA